MKKNNIILGTTMRKYILAMFALLMAITISAQTISPQEERELYQRANSLIHDYARAAAVKDERMAGSFKELFGSTDMYIYNDLMSLSYESKLTVEEYASLLQTKARQTKIEIKNISKGSITETDDNWQLVVTFDKSISFSNPAGTWIDSYEYFHRDFTLKALVVKDRGSDLCYFGSLVYSGIENMDFPQDYSVLVKSDERDNKLAVDGKLVSFNRYDQVLLHPGYKITYMGKEPKEELVENEMDRKIRVNYSDKSFRIRPNVGFSLIGSNSLNGMSGEFKNDKYTEVGYGVDFGYVFRSTGRLQTGFFAGVGMSSNTFSMERVTDEELKSTLDNYDEDGDNYDRIYKLAGSKCVSQKMKATDFVVPLYVDLEFRVNPVFSFFTDLGLKCQLTNLSCDYSGDTDGYNTWGVYHQYGGELVIGKTEGNTEPDVNLNGFGYYKGKITIDDDKDNVKKNFAMDGLLGLGLRFNIGDSFAFDAGVQYQLGLMNSWKNTGKDNTIAHYTEKDGDVFYNFLRSSDGGIKHSALRLSASLIYKF